MPAGFDKCVKDGGKVITVSNGNMYRHVCYIGGKSYEGEVKHKKDSNKKRTGVGKKGVHY